MPTPVPRNGRAGQASGQNRGTAFPEPDERPDPLEYLQRVQLSTSWLTRAA
jgi:hypothetical protein